jgi:hypothetical protein
MTNSSLGQVAQLVEQWTENPCVGGSIPPLSTTEYPQAVYPAGYAITFKRPAESPQVIPPLSTEIEGFKSRVTNTGQIISTSPTPP